MMRIFVDKIEPLRGVTNLHGEPQKDRLEKLLQVIFNIHKANDNDPILEFGIGSGYSLANMKVFADTLNMTNQFIGFDSFEGLPEDEGPWRKGWFASPFETTIKSFDNLTNYKLIPGFYNISLTEKLKNELNIKTVSLIHIDCDLYSSTKYVLNWVKDFIKEGTWIVFDEWKDGENIAWNQFIFQNPLIRYNVIDPGEEQRIIQVFEI